MNINYTFSCCETSLVPVVVLGDVEGARVASKIAAEVVDFSILKVFVADAFDVVSVRGLHDVDLAVIDKLL